MTFKGLSDRFEAKQKALYRKYSPRDGSTDGEPYIINYPDDIKNNQRHSSRTNYTQSSIVDAKRLGSYLTSSRGLLWLLDQQNLQSGNIFSQTRIINPLFVIGNTIPTSHLRRPLSIPSSFDLTGNLSEKSPASNDKLGVAGRLQLETEKTIVSNVINGSQTSLLTNLLKLLPTNRIITTLSTINNIRSNGSLGVNQRPELDIDGTQRYNNYYSVALWQGFVKNSNVNPISNIERGLASLRVGNIPSAVSSITKGITSGISQIKNDISSLFSGKTSLTNADLRSNQSSGINGSRYFITNESTGLDEGRPAQRYLKDSITVMNNAPIANTLYLIHPYYRLTGNIETQADKAPSESPSAETSLNKLQNLTDSASNDLGRFITQGLTSGFDSANELLNDEITIDSIKNKLSSPINPTQDSAESAMLFPELSLQNRYKADSARISDIGNSITAWKNSLPKDKLGFTKFPPGNGGFKAGDDITIDPLQKSRSISPEYFADVLNTGQGVVQRTSDNLTSEDINSDRSLAETLVDLYFFDVVNRKSIAFRAFIGNLSESVQPDIDSSTRYIGRLERNVVYIGVNRELSLQLYIQAFSESEMANIWEKIKYLTGLCFPATYAGGFMVPPFIKLTLGDIYNNQPGIITQLNYNFNDNTGWEITPGTQAPMGVTVNITYNILEKFQMRSDSDFYNYGLSRASESPTSKNEIPTNPVSLPSNPISFDV